MADKAVEKSIREIAERLTELSKKESPGVFNKDFWTGRMLEFSMKDPAFKVELFRFVDVFSVLKTPEQVAQHLREYFLREGLDLPAPIALSIKTLGTGIGQKLGGGQINAQITDMAKKFIVGESYDQAIAVFEELRKENVGFTLDLLGEAAVSERESQVYIKRYIDAIDRVSEAAKSWSTNNVLDKDALGDIPKVNVSIKLSSFYSAIDPLAFEASVQALVERVKPLLVRARQAGVFINLDLEQYALKELTFEVFRRLRALPELEGWPHLGVVVQAYLKDAYEDAESLVKLAKKTKQPFTIRLVKGAYWDYETVQAAQKGWRVPVFEKKHETDASYEKIAELLLDNYPHVRLAVGSHNLRSVSHAIAYAKRHKLPERAYEVQMLYGMAEPIRRALVALGERVRVYAPVGALLPGMAYLVRRLLENTSNEGFLRQRFVEAKTLDQLLQEPQPYAPPKQEKPRARTLGEPFANDPPLDFADRDTRERFSKALHTVKASLPMRVAPVIDGKEQSPAAIEKRENPAALNDVVAEVGYATKAQAQQAIASCKRAFPAWRDRSVEERANILLAAARIMREERHELSALMVYEVGKTAREADGDVIEAIDFCEYYAREAVRLFAGSKQGDVPGEDNRLTYEARGVAAVVAPWNFPCAILTGMVTAALVTGNTVVMKPAEQASAIALRVYRILRQAGVPEGALQFLPGRGEEVGAELVASPDVALVAFTGSREVGMHILRESSVLSGGQDHIRKVILELGGKNAIIVDSDADLDEAVLGVVHSAFGFAGQKCSACSRVIVLQDRHDELVERLVSATETLVLGRPEAPPSSLGPVVDREAFARLAGAIKDGAARYPRVIGKDPSDAEGYYVPPTIFTGVDPQDKLAQEELFGPVLAVIKAKDFDEALQIANGTKYALTGGVFSRSPDNLKRARTEFRVGNLYLNRGTTGAIVGRQPFGGFKLSGIGSKAGGPDYLLQFVEPRVVTENTMRRGFAPETA
ncbi:MAG: L-glutamate gamma-semialdehyde dehydrogenase [Deltaproteobacteria bacterium]|nr:L-glutamate gamma-semialdehyde dehydrogenase [Deltaproteobacteria bacterium]